MSGSTGPRTPKGKARSSQNACKHWISSQRILPSEEKEAAALRDGLIHDFKPNSLMEREIIDDLVLTRLVKRRIDSAFTREFAKASAIKPVALLDAHDGGASALWNLWGSRRGNRHHDLSPRLSPYLCAASLRILSDCIKERGPLPEDELDLRKFYGTQPTEHAVLLINFFAQFQATLVTGSGDQEKIKEKILETIEAEINRQQERDDAGLAVRGIELNSAFQEPAPADLETLLRYRADNTRELKALLDSFERFRRIRETNN